MEREINLGESQIKNPAEWESPATEKPMENKVIFESDDDALDVATYCIDPECKLNNHDEIVRNFMKNVRLKGYIRKSPVEEIEEMYKNRNVDNLIEMNVLCLKMYDLIQYLKVSQK